MFIHENSLMETGMSNAYVIHTDFGEIALEISKLQEVDKMIVANKATPPTRALTANFQQLKVQQEQSALTDTEALIAQESAEPTLMAHPKKATHRGWACAT